METKSAFIAIVGRPNVGKSSLLNSLLGEKVAIVTDKPQTTRTRITGVLTNGACQYVFTDTPGLHTAKNKLSDNMVKAVSSSISDVDAVLLVIDATQQLNKAEEDLIQNIKRSGLPCGLIINKIDLLPAKEQSAAKIESMSKLHDFDFIIPVSVTQNDGVDIVLKEIEQFAYESVHYFPDDTLTDQPERVLAAEMLREKLMRSLMHEIPHGIAVVTEQMKERNSGGRDILDISMTIYCEKKSHKGIIIGKNGAMLKKTAAEARMDMESFFGTKVNLQCWVKIKEDWRNKETFIKDFGLSV